MDELLIQRLAKIEEDSLDEIVREQRLESVFNHARQKYEVIDKAVNGEVSFIDIVNALSKKYEGLKLFLPRIKDRIYDGEIDRLQLNELVQADFFRTDSAYHLGKPMGWFYDKFASPVTVPLIFMAYTSLTGGGEKELFIGIIAGFAAGFVGSLIRHSEMMVTKSQANYLQEQINLYKNNRISEL